MNLIDFQNTIKQIPKCYWEENSNIGDFRSINLENFLQRKYSYVAKCRVYGSTAGTGVYIKYYKKDKNLSHELLIQSIERDFQTLQHYHQKFNGSKEFGIVKPLFAIPDKFILVTQEVDGRNLFQEIEEKCRFYPSNQKNVELEKKVYLAGSWLRYLHSLDPDFQQKYSVDELIDYIKIRFEILKKDKRRHFSEKYVRKILDFIDKNRDSVTEDELKIHSSHNDFNLGNIVIEGSKVTVLDFGKIKNDSFLVDLSRIYHQLFLLTFKPQYRKKVIQKLQKELLKGFGLEYGEHLMLFRFFIIRHTLTHLVGITKFWQVNFKERLYNYWVLYKELNYLDHLLKASNPVTFE